MRTKSEVVTQLQEMYGVNAEQARSMIQYHLSVRKALNDIGMSAAVVSTQKFETKQGVASTISETVKEGAGAIPVVGPIASFVGHLATLGIKKLESYSIEKDAKKISKMSPAQDLSDWHQFTKKLATEMVEKKVEEMRSKSESEIEKLTKKPEDIAKEDSGKIIGKIIDGKVSTTIYDDETIPSLVEVLTKNKGKNTPPPTCKPLSVKALQQPRAVAIGVY